MKRSAVVRHVTLGALAAGLVPLVPAGGRAGAAPVGNPAALCRSTFGERGPGGGPVVGEGPPGDPMPVTVGWSPGDWGDGLSQIVTCVSVGGRATPWLTWSTVAPPNTGSVTLQLKLPGADTGSLVCEQSVLIGTGSTEGRSRPTSPVCFKLRAAEPPLDEAGGPAPDGHGSAVPGSASAGPPARAPRFSTGPPAVRPPAAPPAPVAPAPRPPAAVSPPAPRPAAAAPVPTPPARAAFEARVSAASAAGPSTPRTASSATARATATVAGAAAPGAAPTPPAARTPAAALPRTGLDRAPLTGAGAFLALGGAAIVLGEPRRRSSPRRLA